MHLKKTTFCGFPYRNSWMLRTANLTIPKWLNVRFDVFYGGFYRYQPFQCLCKFESFYSKYTGRRNFFFDEAKLAISYWKHIAAINGRLQNISDLADFLNSILRILPCNICRLSSKYALNYIFYISKCI